jgi:hypothetical protein
MERLGQQEFVDELDGSKIHRLANIMTLDRFFHTQFNRLSLWLGADEVSRDSKRCGYQDNLNFADATPCLPHLLIRQRFNTRPS